MTTITQPGRVSVGRELAQPAHAVDRTHRMWVRVAHWIVTISFLALGFSGFVILMAHPRLYWGNTGNDLTPALLELPISRNYRHGGFERGERFFQNADSPVSAVRTYDIFNENGWGRSLHFLSAWFLVGAGLVYLAAGIFTGHIRRHLVPRRGEFTANALWREVREHARLNIPAATGGPTYGLLQKCAYAFVALAGLPLAAVTGLAMSPAVAAAVPFVPGIFGGVQSARTLHFASFVVLIVFVIVHVVMIVMSGFARQMRAMTFGD